MAPDCRPPTPMNSRNTSSRMKVKWKRTGTPNTTSEPTLPAAGRAFDLSSFVTHPFDAVEGAEVPDVWIRSHAARPAIPTATAPPIALLWRIALRYFQRHLRYFQAILSL